MNAADQNHTPPKWTDIANDPDFKAADWQTKQRVRGEFYRRAIEPEVPESLRTEVQSQFFTRTQADVFGEREEAASATEMQEEAPGLLSNALRNAGERALDLAGNALQFVGNAADRSEQAITDRLGGINPGVIGGSVDEMRARGYEPDIELGGFGLDFTARANPDDTSTGLIDAGQGVEDISLGYKPNYTIDRALDNPSIRTLAGAAAEQGPAALADMAGLVVSLPAYLAARTQEIGEGRVRNDNREGMPEGRDYAVSGPTAAASVLLDRFALGRLLPGSGNAVTSARQIPGTVGRAAVTESVTEAIQEGGIEYAGESVGTETGWNAATAARRAAGGVIVGGPTGGAVRAGTAAMELRGNNQQRSEQTEPRESPAEQSSPALKEAPITEAETANDETIGTAAELIGRPRFELSSAEREARDSISYGDAFKALRATAEERGDSESVAELDSISRELSVALEAETMARSRNDSDALTPIREQLQGAASRFTQVMDRLNNPAADVSADGVQAEDGNAEWVRLWQEQGVENPEQGVEDAPTIDIVGNVGQQSLSERDAIDLARQAAAEQGGDALQQVVAGEAIEAQQQQARQSVERDSNLRAQRQQKAAEIERRIEQGMSSADGLQALLRNTGVEGGMRLRALTSAIGRADSAAQSGNIEQASRLMEKAENISNSLRVEAEAASVEQNTERNNETVTDQPTLSSGLEAQGNALAGGIETPRHADLRQGLQFRTSGQPFASERAAMMSRFAREAEQNNQIALPVRVDGGFALEVREGSAAEAQAESAQPQVELPAVTQGSSVDASIDEKPSTAYAKPTEMNLVRNENGQVDFQASVEQLAPVPDGFTRLYRASSPTVKFSDVFEAEGLEQFRRDDLEGVRYTNDPNYAEYYRSSYGRDAKVDVLDVRNEDLKGRAVTDYEFVIDDGSETAQNPSVQVTSSEETSQQQEAARLSKPANSSEAAEASRSDNEPEGQRNGGPGSSAWQRAEAKGLDLSQEGRMQRAREMGYISAIDDAIAGEVNRDGQVTRRRDQEGRDGRRDDAASGDARPLTVYHGTAGDIDGFQRGHRDQYDAGWLGQGIYVTTNPEQANVYAEKKSRRLKRGGDNVLPLHIKPSSLLKLPADAKRRLAQAGPEATQAFSESLKQHGYDGVIVEYGNTQEIVLFNESDIRSTQAVFDPDDEGSNDLLFSTREAGREISVGADDAPLAADITAALAGMPELADARVIQSASALPPEALIGMVLRGVNPRDVRGMFVGGDLYVIADNVTSTEEGVRTAVHEAVGHKGIRGVLGDELDTVMRQVYRSLPLDRRGREALEEVLESYPFLDQSNPEHQITIAEEMIAHLAEKGWQPGVIKRAIGRVRELLRKAFPNMRWTDTDVMQLSERSREYLRSQQEKVQASTDPRSDMRFSMATPPGGNFNPNDSTNFALPDESLSQTALRKIADKMNRLKVAQEAIKKAGGNINEDNDVYLAEELFHGKTERDLNELSRNYVEKLAKGMAARGIQQEELDAYLYARHAPERNARIAERNPDDPRYADGGSGMTNAEAAAIMQEAESSGKKLRLERLAAIVDDMLAHRREIIREGGLESDETLDAWDASYDYYVPLKGWANDEDVPVGQDGSGRMRSGRGYEIGGREAKTALGRLSKAASPSTQAIVDTTESVIRKRKNEVGNALLSLITDNPNPDLWQVFTNNNPDTQRTQVERTNPDGTKRIEVEERPVAMEMNERYFKTKKAGRTYYIKINDQRLLNAMRNVGPEQNNLLVRTAAAGTRALSAMMTSYNPEFMLTNFTRDVQTALLNVAAEQTRDDGKIKGQKIARQTARDIPRAMKAAYRGLADPDAPRNTEWDRWFDEFIEDGAKTGYFDMKDLAGQAKEIKSIIGRENGGAMGNMLKAKKTVADFVENMNGSVENAVRLSAYVNARRAGISRKKAASLAKNLTVNFNRRGEAGTALNAAYMFANASIQGTMNVARTMATVKDTPVGGNRMNIWGRMNAAQKLAVGMAVGSYAIAMFNRMMSDEDDDGELFYDKIPGHVKERNLIIMTGGKDYVRIPLPYGYNVFSNIGTHAESVMSGKSSLTEAGKDMTLAILGSFSPIGFQDSEDTSNLVMKNLTPTLLGSVTQVAVNEDFAGRVIFKENFPFGTPKPDSSLAFRSTPSAYQSFAQFINELTGGSEYRSGGIDVSPDVLQHVVNYYGGGAWSFTEKVADSIKRTATGETIDAHRIPFVGRFRSEVNEYGDIQTFYERRTEVGQLHEEFINLPREEARSFYDEHGGKIALFDMATDLEKTLTQLRKVRDAIEADDRLTAAERDEQLDEIEDAMDSEVDFFNLLYNQAEGTVQ